MPVAAARFLQMISVGFVRHPQPLQVAGIPIYQVLHTFGTFIQLLDLVENLPRTGHFQGEAEIGFCYLNSAAADHTVLLVLWVNFYWLLQLQRLHDSSIPCFKKRWNVERTSLKYQTTFSWEHCFSRHLEPCSTLHWCVIIGLICISRNINKQIAHVGRRFLCRGFLEKVFLDFHCRVRLFSREQCLSRFRWSSGG